MEDTRSARAVQRSLDVREDWLAWLPEEKDRFFDSVHSELETSYVIYQHLAQRRPHPVPGGPAAAGREQAAIVVSLFDGLARQLQGVLRALGEHGRHFGTVPAVIPLRPGFFRSADAQRIARANHLVSRVLVQRASPLFPQGSRAPADRRRCANGDPRHCPSHQRLANRPAAGIGSRNFTTT